MGTSFAFSDRLFAGYSHDRFPFCQYIMLEDYCRFLNQEKKWTARSIWLFCWIGWTGISVERFKISIGLLGWNQRRLTGANDMELLAWDSSLHQFVFEGKLSVVGVDNDKVIHHTSHDNQVRGLAWITRQPGSAIHSLLGVRHVHHQAVDGGANVAFDFPFDNCDQRFRIHDHCAGG